MPDVGTVSVASFSHERAPNVSEVAAVGSTSVGGSTRWTPPSTDPKLEELPAEYFRSSAAPRAMTTDAPEPRLSNCSFSSSSVAVDFGAAASTTSDAESTCNTDLHVDLSNLLCDTDLHMQ